MEIFFGYYWIHGLWNSLFSRQQASAYLKQGKYKAAETLYKQVAFLFQISSRTFVSSFSTFYLLIFRFSPELTSASLGLVQSRLSRMMGSAGKITHHTGNMAAGTRRLRLTVLLSLLPSGIWVLCTAGKASLKQRRHWRSVRWGHDRTYVTPVVYLEVS